MGSLNGRLARLERAVEARATQGCPSCAADGRIRIVYAPVVDGHEPADDELREAARCRACGRPGPLMVYAPSVAPLPGGSGSGDEAAGDRGHQ